MISVNTNIANLRVQSCLATSNSQLSTAMERMSTGYRINTAKDDAAGLYVGTNLNTQLRGLNIANQNAQMGAALINLADSSLSQMTDSLLRVRELALQAANGVYDTKQKTALQDEADQMIAEIFRLKETTSYNGINIFNGTSAVATNAGAADGSIPAVATLSGGGG